MLEIVRLAPDGGANITSFSHNGAAMILKNTNTEAVKLLLVKILAADREMGQIIYDKFEKY